MGTLKERIIEAVKQNYAPDVAEAQIMGAIDAPVGTSENPSDKILTLANLITLARLVLTLAFLALFIRHEHRTMALAFYVIAAVSDYLDGWVARSTQTVSWVGKVMDPIMDRVLLFTGVLGLVIIGDLPIWVAVFVIGRDLILLGGNIYLRNFWKRPVDVLFIGKVATALFMTGFCFLLLDIVKLTSPAIVGTSWLPGINGEVVSIGIYMIYVAIVLSTITAVKYYRDGFAVKDKVLAERARLSQQG